MLIDYCKEGVAVGDLDALTYVMDAYKLGLAGIKVSTENVLAASRVLIKRGDLDYTNIKYLVEGEDIGIEVDYKGRLITFKEGFGGTMDDMLNELLGFYAIKL